MKLRQHFLKGSVLVSLAVLLYGCPPETPDPPPAAPTAAFSYTSTRNIPVQVSFVNLSTSPLPGPSTFEWDFGDGSNSIISNPVHMYAAAGVYNIKLVQQYANGTKDTVIKALALNAAGPSGISTSPNGIMATDFSFSFVPSFTVTFTNTSANAVSYLWNFGNGSSSTATTATVTAVYSGNGPYTVTLKAVNAAGEDTCSAKLSF